MATTLGQTGYNFMLAAGNSWSSSFSADPAAGSTILVGTGHAVAADDLDIVSSVTDNASNAYALVSSSRHYINGENLEIWRAYNVATTGSLTVTVTYLNPNMTNRRLHVVEVVGAETASDPIDLSSGSVQDGPGTGSNAVTTGPLGTPSTDGQFVFAMSIFGYSPDNVNIGTGYTALGTYNYGESNRAEYLIQGTAAPVAGTFTNDLEGGVWATAAVTVKAAGGGGGGGGSGAGSTTRIDSLGNIQTRIGPSERNVFNFNS